MPPKVTQKAARTAREELEKSKKRGGELSTAALERTSRKDTISRLKKPGAVYDEKVGVERRTRARPDKEDIGKIGRVTCIH